MESSNRDNQGSEKAPSIEKETHGVSLAEIARWKAVANRFTAIRSDLNKDPRDKNTINFLNDPLRYTTAESLINNPLNLIRPYRFGSLNELYEGSNENDIPPFKNQREHGYVEVIETFERFATKALSSLNELDPHKRRGEVKAALERIFVINQDKPYMYRDIRKDSPDETPQEWLVYTVLNLLDNPSAEITPTGRFRALELLEIFPSEELAKGFEGKKRRVDHPNNFTRKHTPKLPITFCDRDERLQKDHKDTWIKNKKVNQLLVKDSMGTVDWRATTTKITEQAPEDAIQLALLFLHDRSMRAGGLAFLRAIPHLDSETKAKMFGKHASFILERGLSGGLDQAVLEGMGSSVSIRSDIDLEGKTSEELIQLLRRKERTVADLEETLAITEAKMAKLAWENADLNARINQLGSPHGKGELTRGISVDSLDPKGYYRILGLHPQIFEQLSEDKILDLVKRHYHMFSRQLHPDLGGDKQKMQQINEAYSVMSDPNKRVSYGK